ncbi:hypothetical protein MHBO_003878 [Bonamia ostreae]|uniref:BZIP domain-containing protein n=1 Tax=Bonamia ostreae TaxID=126728 RepID=A0ABV2ARS1_9EUKA
MPTTFEMFSPEKLDEYDRKKKNRESAKKSRFKAAVRNRQIAEEHKILKIKKNSLKSTFDREQSNYESIIKVLKDTLEIKQGFNKIVGMDQTDKNILLLDNSELKNCMIENFE